MTAASRVHGVILPPAVTIGWRDADGAWHALAPVAPSASCGPSPCAQASLPPGAQVTGVRATFLGGGQAGAWYMISELSTQ
jgi:hypothetical protein